MGLNNVLYICTNLNINNMETFDIYFNDSNKLEMKTIKSNKEDLFFCHLGNGVSVCDRLRKENGDYIEVAHISYERAIIYYNSISDESREIIERFALHGNINMSVTQPYPVLNIQTDSNNKGFSL